jgi:hypothetical protein
VKVSVITMEMYLRKRLKPLVRDVVIPEMLKKGWTRCPMGDHWTRGAKIGVNAETGQVVGCRECIMSRGEASNAEGPK